jgi:hypothetical protein
MGTEIEIALVLAVAFLWVVGTFAILSGIDRLERKARRQERRADRERQRRVQYRPVVPGSRLMGRDRQGRSRLRPH